MSAQHKLRDRLRELDVGKRHFENLQKAKRRSDFIKKQEFQLYLYKFEYFSIF